MFWHNIAYECIIQQIESEFTLKILALYTKNAKRTLDVSDKLTYLDLAHIQNMRHAFRSNGRRVFYSQIPLTELRTISGEIFA